MKKQIVLLYLCFVVLLGCNKTSQTELPTLEVWLNDSIHSIRGKNWPLNGNKTIPAMTAKQEPCKLTLHFPSQRAYTTKAKLVILSQQDEKIYRVDVSPFSELVGFQQAVENVETILKDLRKELKIDKDPLLEQKLNEWRKEIPESSVSARVVIEKNVSVFIEIKPYDLDAKTWYTTLGFSYFDRGAWDKEMEIK